MSCFKSATHTHYDIDNPPERLSTESTRFICISDTHGETFPVPNGDVLLHAGDLTALGEVEDMDRTMTWICSLPHPIKIIIGGNHDLPLDDMTYESNWKKLGMGPLEDVGQFRGLLYDRRAKRAGVIYLEHSSAQFEVRRRTWSVYGSPASPSGHGGSAFAYRRGCAEPLYKAIPETIDILLTHTPPQGILDGVEWAGRQVHPGCKELFERVAVVRPLLHVFGHIHETHGVRKHEWNSAATSLDSDKTTASYTIFVNGASQPTGRGVERIQKELGIEDRRLETGLYPFQPVIVDIE